MKLAFIVGLAACLLAWFPMSASAIRTTINPPKPSVYYSMDSGKSVGINTEEYGIQIVDGIVGKAFDFSKVKKPIMIGQPVMTAKNPDFTLCFYFRFNTAKRRTHKQSDLIGSDKTDAFLRNGPNVFLSSNDRRLMFQFKQPKKKDFSIYKGEHAFFPPFLMPILSGANFSTPLFWNEYLQHEWNFCSISFSSADSLIRFQLNDVYQELKGTYSEKNARIVLGGKTKDRVDFAGEMDEVIVFNSYLTNEELTEFYKSELLPAEVYHAKDRIKYVVIILVITIVPILLVIYMFVLMYKHQTIKEVRLDAMLQKRSSGRYSAEKQEEMNRNAFRCLSECYEQLSPISNQSENRRITNRSQLDYLQKKISEAVSFEPVEDGTISWLNNLIRYYNVMKHRTFTGSTFILFGAIILVGLLAFGTYQSTSMDWLKTLLFTGWMLPGILFYYVASLTPQYRIDLDAEHDKPNDFFVNMMYSLAGIGAVMAVSTYYTEYRYSDGTVVKDHSEGIAMKMMVFALLAVVAILYISTILIWSFRNLYINYISKS
ncbi:hypothetical protein EP331_00650 [bacterium]|nr:MAG: hypothetical protein EP331_00650 [bacterium]